MKKAYAKRKLIHNPIPILSLFLFVCFFLIMCLILNEDTAGTIDTFLKLKVCLHKQTTNKDVGMGL